jgi:small conductance mechanosensitive channel
VSLFQRMFDAFSNGLGSASESVGRGVAEHLPAVLAAVLVLVLGWIVARVTSSATRRVLARTSTESHVDLLVARTVWWSVLSVAIVMALAVAGVNVAALVASLGLAGLTIGFALRDVLANSVAGVMLLLQRPFRIGDTISVGATEGVVTDVRVRDTVVLMPDGRVAYVPNMTVFNDVVINSSQAKSRRFEVVVWAPSAGDLDAALEHVRAALAATPGVLEQPGPEAALASVGPERARIVGHAWVDTSETALAATQSGAAGRARAALESEPKTS